MRLTKLNPRSLTRVRVRTVGSTFLVVVLLAAACGSGGGQALPGPDKVIDLPGAPRPTRFDDLTYSARLGRVLVPAQGAGLYLVDPGSGQVTRFENLGTVDSAAEGDGMALIADRRSATITAVDPDTGGVVASARTAGPPDYLRYVPAKREVWVTEKGERAGIEIFGFGTPTAITLTATAFISIPDEPEGLTIADSGRRAYTQSVAGEVLAVDVERREVVGRWPTGCNESHGIPALDEQRGLLLAGCAGGGKGVLLDVEHDGKRLDTYAVKGDEALMAHAPTGRFYLRADPGSTIATLEPTADGKLTPVRKTNAPRAGHCLTADDVGHYWTCDQREAKLLRYTEA